MKLPVVLRGEIELDELPSAAATARSRYYMRSTAPIEARAWDRAVREIPVFRPGRELMVSADDLHRWIESHAVDRTASVDDADETASVPYSEFQAAQRRRAAR